MLAPNAQPQGAAGPSMRRAQQASPPLPREPRSTQHANPACGPTHAAPMGGQARKAAGDETQVVRLVPYSDSEDEGADVPSNDAGASEVEIHHANAAQPANIMGLQAMPAEQATQPVSNTHTHTHRHPHTRARTHTQSWTGART